MTNRVSNQQIAHAAASEKWQADGKRSPTAGLAYARKPPGKPQLAYTRQTNVLKNKAQLKQIYKAALRVEKYAVKDSRYFPHQGPAECARRRKQMEGRGWFW